MERLKRFFLKNTSDKQTFIKNTVWLFIGEIIGRLLKLAIVIYATRKFGVDGWGLFSYGLAFVSFFYVLGDLGINIFITREMSKDNKNKYTHVGTSFIIKMGLLFGLFIISLIAGPYIGNIQLGLPFFTVLSVLYFSDCAREFALSVVRASGKMEQEAFSKIMMSAIITILGIVLILKAATPMSLAIAYMVGSVIATIFVMWSIRKEFRLMDWNLSKESVRIIYAFSWPILIISLSSFVFNIDAIMLGQMRSTIDVGLYAAAQRIVQFLAIMLGFIATSAFPLLSKHEGDDGKMTNIIERIMILVCAFGAPIAIGGLLLGTQLMTFMFGADYATGGATFGILMISLFAYFPNTILTTVIFSKNMQRRFMSAIAYGIATNIALNFILIPPYGAVGAAWSVVVTQFVIMIINWKMLKKYVSFSVIPKTGKILIACIAMALVIFIFNSIGAHLIVTIVVAAAAYAASLFLLKESSVGEILSLIKK
ncbi:MAG: flippase [Candidatus Paceibacterota bacterium]